MEIRSYNAELAYANILFARPFRNIVIQRKSGQKITDIHVNCVYGQRSRILKNFQNSDKRAEMKLPMIVITRTGINRNQDRLNNLHNEVKHQTSAKSINYDLYTPIPIDISYDVSIIAKFPGDIDKIVSNFICFFNQDIFVSSPHPKFTDVVLNSQIIMQDNINEEHPEELDPTTDDIIVSTCQFTFKTYIFGGENTRSTKNNVVTKVSTIVSTWIDPQSSSEVSAYVDISSDVIYDGFIPTIQKIDVGFYATPANAEYIQYMDFVDERYPSCDIFADLMIWRIDEQSEKSFPYNIRWYKNPEISAEVNTYISDYDAYLMNSVNDVNVDEYLNK